MTVNDLLGYFQKAASYVSTLTPGSISAVEKQTLQLAHDSAIAFINSTIPHVDEPANTVTYQSGITPDTTGATADSALTESLG